MCFSLRAIARALSSSLLKYVHIRIYNKINLLFEPNNIWTYKHPKLWYTSQSETGRHGDSLSTPRLLSAHLSIINAKLVYRHLRFSRYYTNILFLEGCSFLCFRGGKHLQFIELYVYFWAWCNFEILSPPCRYFARLKTSIKDTWPNNLRI